MERLVIALRERSQTLVEMAQAAVPYLQQDMPIEDEAAEKFLTPAIAPTLGHLSERLAALPEFTKPGQEAAFKEVMERAGLKMGQLAQPVRVALTGRAASPGIFEVIDLLGREQTLARLRKGVERAKAARP